MLSLRDSGLKTPASADITHEVDITVEDDFTHHDSGGFHCIKKATEKVVAFYAGGGGRTRTGY